MHKLTVTVLFVIVSITWGTTWLAMRVAVETIPPVFATGMRFMFAAPILIGIACLRNTPLYFPPGQRFFQLQVGLFYFAIPFSLMVYSETIVSSGLAAVIFSNMPVAILAVSTVFLGEKKRAAQIIGLSIAVTSLTGILLEETHENDGSHWPGIVALVLAVVMHAIVYTLSIKRCCSVSVITFNDLPCLLAGGILSVTGFLLERPDLAVISRNSILATLYLGAFAGVFGILCYFYLQKKAGAFPASLVFLVFPIIALSLENYIYDDFISDSSLFLMIPLAAGIFLTLLSKENSVAKRQ